MKLFLSDRTNSVGQALESLALSCGYEICGEPFLEEADIVILCARRADPMTFEDGSLDRLFATFDHHVKSAFLYGRRAAHAMMARGEGSILLIGSGDADKPNGRAIGFSAAMGGIKLLFRDLTLDRVLSGTGVRANLLETAEVADSDDPAHTAALALSVAENAYMSGCEIRTDAAHYHQK